MERRLANGLKSGKEELLGSLNDLGRYVSLALLDGEWIGGLDDAYGDIVDLADSAELSRHARADDHSRAIEAKIEPIPLTVGAYLTDCPSRSIWFALNDGGSFEKPAKGIDFQRVEIERLAAVIRRVEGARVLGVADDCVEFPALKVLAFFGEIVGAEDAPVLCGHVSQDLRCAHGISIAKKGGRGWGGPLTDACIVVN